MTKKYSLRGEITDDIKSELSEYSEITQKLLCNRGIKTKKEAKEFFNPDYESGLNNPLLLKDIEKATDRILDAIEKKEKILIYSDYDADGIPGAVVLHDFFVKIRFDNFKNYIPHRNDEGFGLNVGAIKEFHKDKVDLIITIDCGISDVEEVEEANKLGIDVIITDHHLQGDVLPKAYAVVNPNQKNDKYPFKHLCGCAVVFKLVQVLIERGNFNIISGWDKWLLDMVGISTISDMMPLVGENRVLSYYGLLVLKKTKRHGLRNLYKDIKLQTKHLNEDDISFSITPRINAASRMDEAHTAFTLLSSTDEVISIESAKRLTKLNDDRKKLTAGIVKEVKRKISQRPEMPPVIVMGNPNWVPSILGLVAGKIAEEYFRPVFLWGRNGFNEIKGSCRSEQNTDVFSLMKSLPDGLLNHFGGHKFSGGFGISNEKIHLLESEIVSHFNKNNDSSSDLEEVFMDAELSINQINWDMVREIYKLSPYGAGNPKPTFLFKGVKIPEINKFGKHNEHLKLNFPNGSKNISAISFFSNEESFTKTIREGETVDLVASIEQSFFRNFPEIRLRIIDII